MKPYSAEWYLDYATDLSEAGEIERHLAERFYSNVSSLGCSFEEISDTAWDRCFISLYEDVNILLESGVSPDRINQRLQLIFEEGDDVISKVGGFFSSLGGGAWKTVKGKFISFVLSLVGIKSDGMFSKFLTGVLMNINVTDFPKLLTDCEFAVTAISKGVVTFLSNVANKELGFMANTVAEFINDAETVKSFQQKAAELACGKLNNVAKKIAAQTHADRGFAQMSPDAVRMARQASNKPSI